MKILRNVLLGILGLAVFLLLLPLLLLIFFTPLRYAVVARVGGKTTVRAKASYLFSLITFRYLYNEGKSTTQFRIEGMRLGGAKKEKTGEKPPSEAEPDAKPEISPEMQKVEKNEQPAEKDDEDDKNVKNEASKSGINMRSILTYPQLKIIIRLTLQCLKKTMGVFLPKRFEIDGRMGFEDPAATGMVFGLYETWVGALGLREKIRIGADFAEPGIRMKISAGGSISFARLSWPLIVLVCKKTVRDFISFLRRS